MHFKSKQELNFWRTNPIAGPTVAFGLGIVSANYYTLSFSSFFWLSSLLCLICSLFIFFHVKSEITRDILRRSSLVILFCFFVGCLSSSLALPENHAYFSGSSIHGKLGVFKFIVKSEPVIDSSGTCKFTAHLESYRINNQWTKASGKYKCKVQLKQDSLVPFVSSTIYLIGKPSLPGYSAPDDEFDYREWLINNKFDGLFQSHNYRLVPQDNFNSIQAYSSNLRSICLKRFLDSKSMPMEGELAGALLLGDRKGIDPALTQSFIDTGIIHLLAVSGLHVGLVFQVISILLAFCFRNKKYSILIIILSLWCLWSYALITGLSASVCRAACMLSMVVLGKGIRRKIPPFNLLIGSAFVLLVVDPNILTDIGFQLSFCAVFGILASNPILNWIKKFRYRLHRIVLVSSTISISAQAATLPISFFYFGRFPLYFLISNLFAIPLASVISYLGFSAIVFQRIPFVGDILIWLTLKGITLLIAFSNLVASFPSSSITFQTLGLSTCIILAYLLILILLHPYFSLSLAIKSGLTVFIFCSLLELRFQSVQHQYILLKSSANHARLSFVNSKNKAQSVELNSKGLYFCLKSPTQTIDQDMLALGNGNYSVLCTSNDFIPVSRPNCKYILMIIEKTNIPQLNSWVEIIRPNLVLIKPSLYHKDQIFLREYCFDKGLRVWNRHSINKIDI